MKTNNLWHEYLSLGIRSPIGRGRFGTPQTGVPPRIAKSGGSHDAYDTPNDHIDFAIGTTLEGIRNGLLRTGRSAPREIDRADYRILDFSLIIAPSTANLPYPCWW